MLLVVAVTTLISANGAAGAMGHDPSWPGGTSSIPGVVSVTPSGRTLLSASAESPLGYVGCSNTALSVKGYYAVGGTRFWPFNRGYWSGTVERWQTKPQYFTLFDSEQAAVPVKEVWFELCEITVETPGDTLVAARADIARIVKDTGGATVYVSALNNFTDPTCARAVPTEWLRDALVSEGLAQRGPDLPALDASEVQAIDGCHPNVYGQRVLGEALRGFFG